MDQPVSAARRALLTAVAALGTIVATPAAACSLVARVRPQAFSDAACQRSLRALVALINEAPRLSPEVLATRADAISITFADEVSDPILDYPTLHPIDPSDLMRGWSVADDKARRQADPAARGQPPQGR